MTAREIRRYERLVRVRTFGQQNASDIVPGSKAAEKLAVVTQAIADIEAARLKQNSGSDTSKETLLGAIRLDLQNIVRTAAAIDVDEPGFAGDFRPLENNNEGTLLAATAKILANLVPNPNDSADKAAKAAVVAKFVAHEMPSNFVANLQTDVAAVARINTELEQDREDSVGSTSSIGQLIAQANDAVTVLDAIMHNKYQNNAAKLAAWVSASHVERDPKRAKEQPAPAPTPANAPK